MIAWCGTRGTRRQHTASNKASAGTRAASVNPTEEADPRGVAVTYSDYNNLGWVILCIVLTAQANEFELFGLLYVRRVGSLKNVFFFQCIACLRNKNEKKSYEGRTARTFFSVKGIVSDFNDPLPKPKSLRTTSCCRLEPQKKTRWLKLGSNPFVWRRV